MCSVKCDLTGNCRFYRHVRKNSFASRRTDKKLGTSSFKICVFLKQQVPGKVSSTTLPGLSLPTSEDILSYWKPQIWETFMGPYLKNYKIEPLYYHISVHPYPHLSSIYLCPFFSGTGWGINVIFRRRDPESKSLTWTWPVVIRHSPSLFSLHPKKSLNLKLGWIKQRFKGWESNLQPFFGFNMALNHWAIVTEVSNYPSAVARYVLK